MESSDVPYFVILEIFREGFPGSPDVLLFRSDAQALKAVSPTERIYAAEVPLRDIAFDPPIADRLEIRVFDDHPVDDDMLHDGFSYVIHQSFREYAIANTISATVSFPSDTPGWSLAPPTAIGAEDLEGWRRLDQSFIFTRDIVQDVERVEITLREIAIGTGLSEDKAKAVARLHQVAHGAEAAMSSRGLREINTSIDYMEFAASPGRTLEEAAERLASDLTGDPRDPFDVSAFVAGLYETALERKPDTDGGMFWKQALEDQLVTRGELIIAFAESAEMAEGVAWPLLLEDAPSHWVYQ